MALARLRPFVEIVVRIQRLLRRPDVVRDVLKIHPDARPGAKASPHGVHEHVSRLEMARGLRVLDFPSLESSQRIVFLARPTDLDERHLRRAPA